MVVSVYEVIGRRPAGNGSPDANALRVISVINRRRIIAYPRKPALKIIPIRPQRLAVVGLGHQRAVIVIVVERIRISRAFQREPLVIIVKPRLVPQRGYLSSHILDFLKSTCAKIKLL